MNRNRMVVLSSLVGLGMVLSGCGVGGGGDDDAAPPVDGEIAGEITFQTWNLRGGYEDYFTDLIDAFEDEHPEVTVRWVDQPPEGYQDKLSADAVAGTLPDVIDIGPEAAYTLASADMLLDVAAADPQAEAAYLPKSWEAMTFEGLGGGTYGLPWYLNTGPSFFHTALFEECGLDPDDLPESYDELFAQAAVMADNCQDVTMIGRMPPIEAFGMYGVELMNAEGTEFTFNSQAGVELVERYRILYQESGLSEDALNELQTGELESFKAGQLGWLPGSSYTLQDLRETAPQVYENVAIGPLIHNDAPNMYIQSIGVNANSENPATALAFARFITDAANQFAFTQEAAVFPSAAGALDDPYFTDDSSGEDDALVRVAAAAQVGEAVVYWPPAFSSQAVDYLREQIALAISGDKTAQEALDDAVAYANERLASQ